MCSVNFVYSGRQLHGENVTARLDFEPNSGVFFFLKISKTQSLVLYLDTFNCINPFQPEKLKMVFDFFLSPNPLRTFPSSFASAASIKIQCDTLFFYIKKKKRM